MAASIAIRGTPVNAGFIAGSAPAQSRHTSAIAPDGGMDQNRRIASADLRGSTP
jgi:hypothetical protein